MSCVARELDKVWLACRPNERERAEGLSPPRAKRRSPAKYCKSQYRERHKVENMFAKLKDWRRISTRYDRCAYAFFSAICIAATVIFWVGK
ncbi:transposase [Rhizobium leguminosarum]|nr:transposase [Rhizobium leguminosarum]MBY2938015.1 transposase [Rhizobium leguminosarum]MBY3047802.1 transposase [Rhizobium leguminosarum]